MTGPAANHRRTRRRSRRASTSLKLDLPRRRQLVTLWDAGEHTVAELATQFQVSSQTIRDTYRAAGGTQRPPRPKRATTNPPKLGPDQRRQLVELWEAGNHTAAELVVMFDLPQDTLRDIYRRETEPQQYPLPAQAAIRRRRKPHPLKLGPDQRRQLVTLWDAGEHTVAELAVVFDLSEATVRATYRRETERHGYS